MLKGKRNNSMFPFRGYLTGKSLGNRQAMVNQPLKTPVLGRRTCTYRTGCEKPNVDDSAFGYRKLVVQMAKPVNTDLTLRERLSILE